MIYSRRVATTCQRTPFTPYLFVKLLNLYLRVSDLLPSPIGHVRPELGLGWGNRLKNLVHRNLRKAKFLDLGFVFFFSRQTSMSQSDGLQKREQDVRRQHKPSRRRQGESRDGRKSQPNEKKKEKLRQVVEHVENLYFSPRRRQRFVRFFVQVPSHASNCILEEFLVVDLPYVEVVIDSVKERKRKQ